MGTGGFYLRACTRSVGRATRCDLDCWETSALGFEIMTSPRSVVGIVSDDPDAVTMLSEPLKDAGFSVFDAKTADALIVLRSTRSASLVIVVDSPGARTLLRNIQGDSELQHWEVVVVGQPNGSVQGREDAFLLGASGFIIKPRDVLALVRKLKALATGDTRSSSPLEAAAPFSARGAAARRATRDVPAVAGVAGVASAEGEPLKAPAALLSDDLLELLSQPLLFEGDEVASHGPQATRKEPVQTVALVNPPEMTWATAIDARHQLANAMARRRTETWTMRASEGTRWLQLVEGDIARIGSTVLGESLVDFLSETGAIAKSAVRALAFPVPPFGRHAALALVSQGVLAAEEWRDDVRAHCEWLLGRIVAAPLRVQLAQSEKPPAEIADDIDVMASRSGVATWVEAFRRVGGHPQDFANGQGVAEVRPGSAYGVLEEAKLTTDERAALDRFVSGAIAVDATQVDRETLGVMVALQLLGVVEVVAIRKPDGAESIVAVAERVRVRRALVEEGDYFALLGIPLEATGHEVRRAYVDLRRWFEPGRFRKGERSAMQDDVQVVAELLDEAYEVLRSPERRAEYRKAIAPRAF